MDTFERSLTIKGREEGGGVESFVFQLEEKNSILVYYNEYLVERKKLMKQEKRKIIPSFFFQGMEYRT